jgi:RNA polymerase sigma factor (sigma-70 family)
MQGPDSRADGDLLWAARSDPLAFGIFYERHVGRVLGFFRRRVQTSELAFDLTAETFAAALGALGRYTRQEEPAVAWLFAIARHKLSEAARVGSVDDRARRALAMQPIDVDDDGLRLVDVRATGLAMELLDELPDDQSAAIRGRHLDGRSYAAIAVELRCSQSVVRKRVSRGLETLRTEMARRQTDD